MKRSEMLSSVKKRGNAWDFVVIGGGATGVGCAVDAASRGFSVLLLEQSDFGKGTSSRSTKLVHGGVRYLANGDISLVREALKERGILLKNAPHLVKKAAFVVPVYSFWDKFFYGSGLKIYNFLSGKYGFGKSRILSKKETLKSLPNVKSENLAGGIVYFDGQFDDARLLIDLIKTGTENGAIFLNYAKVFGFTKAENGKIAGVDFQDEISGEIFSAKAEMVINATGAFCDSVRALSDAKAQRLVEISQGVHLVFDKKFLPAENALMIPKTSDGRVLFVIPWHDKILTGTTDTPVEKAELEPRAMETEIEFILETTKNYLEVSPKREDILSVFAGIRPLVKSENTKNTAKLSREHAIVIDESNLLTITGGKWTTYRRMAEDAVSQAIKTANLPEKKCVTGDLQIHGSTENSEKFGDLSIYGADAKEIQKLIDENPDLAGKIHEDLPYRKAEIIWTIKNEMPQTVEDVLSRRTRALILNAKAAVEVAPQTAKMMAEELNKDAIWIDTEIKRFNEIAKNYLVKI
jgi:glycerol-3-phosphate dehydrogenase